MRYDKLTVLSAITCFKYSSEQARRMLIQSRIVDEPWYNSAFLYFVLRKAAVRPCSYTLHVLFGRDSFTVKREFDELLDRARRQGMTDVDESLVRNIVEEDCKAYYRERKN